MIIDDALDFSDPSRLEMMGAAIAAAGRTCQIVILTCTPGWFTHVGNAEVVRFWLSGRATPQGVQAAAADAPIERLAGGQKQRDGAGKRVSPQI